MQMLHGFDGTGGSWTIACNVSLGDVDVTPMDAKLTKPYGSLRPTVPHVTA